MKYKVTTYIYDNGKSEFGLAPAENDEISHFETRPLHDFYVDVFDNYKEAKEFYDECVAEEGINAEDDEELEPD